MPWFWNKSPGREDRVKPTRGPLMPIPTEFRDFFHDILSAGGLLDDVGMPRDPSTYEDIIQTMARRFDVFVSTQICMAMTNEQADEYLRMTEHGVAPEERERFLSMHVQDLEALRDRAIVYFKEFYIGHGNARSRDEIATLILNRAPPYSMPDDA